MKDIVLLSNKPCKHIKYLRELERRGCKVTVLFSKMYYAKHELSHCYERYVPETYEKISSIFPAIKVENIEEVEKFYEHNSNDIVIILDMEPGNILSYDIWERHNSSEIIYYSAETIETIGYLNTHIRNKEKILIPRYLINGFLKYEDYDELLTILKKASK